MFVNMTTAYCLFNIKPIRGGIIRMFVNKDTDDTSCH